eukprot:88399_1
MSNNLNKNANGFEGKEGSLCEIYSKSNKKWVPGLVMRVSTDEKEEWVEVIYKSTKTKFSRLDKKIRSLMNKITDDEVSRLKDMKERYEWKAGSFCEMYSTSKKKWFKAVIDRVFTNDEGERLYVLYAKTG